MTQDLSNHSSKPKTEIDNPKKSTTRVNFELERDKHKRLKIYAAKRDVTIADLMRELVSTLDDSKA